MKVITPHSIAANLMRQVENQLVTLDRFGKSHQEHDDQKRITDLMASIQDNIDALISSAAHDSIHYIIVAASHLSTVFDTSDPAQLTEVFVDSARKLLRTHGPITDADIPF